MARPIEIEITGDSRKAERAFERTSRAAERFSRDVTRSAKAAAQPLNETFDRIRQAARYIFAPHTLRFGNYVELALRNEDVDRLAEFIETRRKQGG